MSAAPAALRGSIVPLVTPFTDGAVDLDAFEAAVDRQAQSGSHGIVVTGTSGEPTSLTSGERSALYRRAAAVAGDRLCVVAATGSANHAETLELTRAATEAGVDAVMVVCPAFVRPSQDGLIAHFTAVGSSTDLPWLIYNIPGRSGVGVTAETTERLAEATPNLVGLKHASVDLDLVTDLLLRLGEDFRLFCGLESYSYPFLAVGGAGLMNAVGNLLPGELAQLCDCVRNDDHASALRLHRELFRLNEAIFYDTNPGPLKMMLAMAGLSNGELRLPLIAPGEATRKRVSDAVGSFEAARAGGVR